MSISAPSSFSPLAATDFSADRPIKRTPEAALAANVHYIYLHDRPPVVDTIFTAVGYAVGNTTLGIVAVWNRDTYGDPFGAYEVQIAWSNTGTGNGLIRVDIASDPYNGTTGSGVDLTATASTAAWQVSQVTIPIDPTQASEAIRLWAQSPASGEVRIHSVEIRPRVPAISAGADGHGWLPIDTTETDADSPLSVWVRQTELDDLEVVRKVRSETILGWSEDVQVRASGGSETYAETASTYTEVARIGFRSGPGQTSIRWALYGYYAGSSGAVRLELASTGEQVDVTLGSAWTSPYAAALHRFDDVGMAALGCAADKADEVIVSVKGDGSFEGRLMGLNLWFAPAT